MPIIKRVRPSGRFSLLSSDVVTQHVLQLKRDVTMTVNASHERRDGIDGIVSFMFEFHSDCFLEADADLIESHERREPPDPIDVFHGDGFATPQDCCVVLPCGRPVRITARADEWHAGDAVFSVFGHEFVRIKSPKPLKVYAVDKLCPGPGPVRFSDLKRQLQRKVMG